MLDRLRLSWVREAAISASLGHGMRNRVRLGWFHVRIALARAFGGGMPSPITVGVAPDGHQITVAEPGELSVLSDIMVNREYETDRQPLTILDLGANVGFATLFFSRRYPSATIGSVEADPRTFERLVGNVSGLPNVATLNRVVSGREGRLVFYCSAQSISSSLTRRSLEDVPVEVDSMTVADLMDHFGMERVGLLKMDIEGAEFDALTATPIDRVDELMVELHYDLGQGDERLVRSLLNGLDLSFKQSQKGRVLVYGRRSE
jgi:FkbM family methyltransferase